MTRLATLIVAFFALVAIGSAGVVTMQARILSGVRTELSTTQVALASTQADLRRAYAAAATAEADRKSQADVLADERERAVAAEREVADLKALIAKERDPSGQPDVKPVLKNTIGRILKTGTTRQDALFQGRMHPYFRLVVTVDGRVETRREVRGFKECRDLAAAQAVALSKREELARNPRRASIRCDELPVGGSA